jgi:predicted dehydrogenase
MRVALIGPGDFAERGPLPAIALTPGIELVAVQSRSRAKAESAAERHGAATVCATVAEVCARPDVDALFIVTPPAPHPQLLREVIEAGKPFIVDKPVTLGSRDLAPLVRLAEERGVRHAVDHEFRYDPSMIAIADLVRGGALGRVRTSIYDLVATFANDPAFASQRYWSFHHSASEGGGLLPQVASHHIDLHLYCLGAIQACGGYLATLVSERPTAPEQPGGPDGPMRPVDVEDCAALAARLASGGAATMTFTHVATSMPDLRWLIHGDAGSLAFRGHSGWFDGTLTLAQGWMGTPEVVSIPERVRRSSAPGLNGWMQDLICELLLDFADSLGGGSGPHRFATLADELIVWELIEQWRTMGR